MFFATAIKKSANLAPWTLFNKNYLIIMIFRDIFLALSRILSSYVNYSIAQ